MPLSTIDKLLRDQSRALGGALASCPQQRQRHLVSVFKSVYDKRIYLHWPASKPTPVASHNALP